MTHAQRLLKQWLDKFEWHEDAGPFREGWQSEEFCKLIAETKLEIEEGERHVAPSS